MAFGAAFRIKLGLLFALLCVAIAILEPAALGLATGFENAAWSLGRWLYIPAAVYWLLVAPLWLKHACRPLAKSVPGLAVGLLLILPTWLASVQLRQAGAPTLISVMAVVWVADIAAYMFGRTFGRHRWRPASAPARHGKAHWAESLRWLSMVSCCRQKCLRSFRPIMPCCCPRLSSLPRSALSAISLSHCSNARPDSKTAAMCFPDMAACWIALTAFNLDVAPGGAGLADKPVLTRR